MQTTVTDFLYLYVAAVNVVTFFIYGLDKSKAKAGRWRIPEANLIFLAVIGGRETHKYKITENECFSRAALAGMRFFHHKTRKPKFYIGIPAILLIQIILIYFLSV